MKIALELSGLSRLNLISVASWSRIIGKYSPDVYIHTWAPASTEILNWTFKPRYLHIEEPIDIDVSLYPDRHWPNIDVYKSLSMWHSINSVHSAVLNSGINYDLIIRGRMDWHVHELNIIDFDGIVIPLDYDKVSLQFRYKDGAYHGLNDHFAYGPTMYMNAYVNTINEIYSLYTDDSIDYCPENFLAASLIKQNVPVSLQRMEHKLIRG